MNIADVLTRIGYVRNTVKLSARELSLRLGMSEQYIAQVERGRINLTVEKLLKILEICNFSVERFFSSDIENGVIDKKLENLIQSLTLNKKKTLIDFISDNYA